MTDHSGATLVWVSDPPSKENIAIVRDKLREYSKLELNGLDNPRDLMFSMVPLTSDWNGPCVVLKGHTGDLPNAFDAEYFPDGAPLLKFDLDDFPDLAKAIEDAKADEDARDAVEHITLKEDKD